MEELSCFSFFGLDLFSFAGEMGPPVYSSCPGLLPDRHPGWTICGLFEVSG